MSQTQTPQERGTTFEIEVVEALGLRAVPRSGAGWSEKSDAAGASLRVSCKANPTTRRTWGHTRTELDEAITMAAGTGQTPALAIEDQDGAQFVMLRLADFASLLASDVVIEREPKRSDVVRQAARTPVLLRNASEKEQ